ncbi:MAG: HPr-rel-A system PqqD family peptide chaperone [Calditrichia bacterium]
MNRLSQLAINEEGFVFDPVSGESFTVNSTGLAILNHLKQNESPAEIAAQLAESFEDVPEELEQDVQDFIRRLQTYKII